MRGTRLSGLGFVLLATASCGRVSYETAAADDAPAGASVVDVRGRVMYGRAPAASAQVSVNGSLSVTDSDGYFDALGVTLPYRLLAVGVERHVVTELDGLTTSTPLLNLGALQGTHSTHIAVVLPALSSTGRTPTLTTRLLYTSPAAPALEDSNLYTAASSPLLRMSARWSGAVSDQGTVLALQWARVAGSRISFRGFASVPAPVAVEQESQLEVAPAPVQEQPLNVPIIIPPGYEQASASLEVGPLSVPLPTLENPISEPAPRVGLPIGISTTATSGQVLLGAREWDHLEQPIELVPPVVVDAPSSETIDHEALFQWHAAPANALVCVRWALTDGDWLITRCQSSSASSTTFPDLSAFGLPLGVHLSGTWLAIHYAAVATPEAGLALQNAIARNEPANQRYAQTAPRAFAFAFE